MNMRQHEIIRLVNQHGKMSVSELSHLTGVSYVTIRNDLKYLNERGNLRRVHGSALALEGSHIKQRVRENFSVKEGIAASAAGFIEDGDSIYLDGCSINYLLLKHLTEKRQLTIVTASQDLVTGLKGTSHRVILVGGILQKGMDDVVGDLACLCISHLTFNKAFIGIKGWDKKRGFSESDSARCAVKNAVLAKGVATWFLGEARRFSQVHDFPLAPTSVPGAVITDNALSPKYRELLAAQQIKLSIVHTPH